MRRRILLAVLVVVALVAAASIILFASTLKLHDQAAIDFGASLNATTVTQGQTVRVYLEDWNKLDTKNTLPMGDGLRAMNLSSGPCGGLYPGGIGLYQGAYDVSNASLGFSLSFYAPGVYGCPAELLSGAFEFQPSENLTHYVDLPGYWTGGNTPQPGGGSSPEVLRPFSPGVYTVIAGDAWGNTRALYFHVVGATGSMERSGPASSFPAVWLDPCAQGAAGNVTTMTNLGLNSTSDFDHINIDQIYATILNSSDFAYRTVGHGWVVAQWYEVQGSANEIGDDDQVIAYFILTSGGTPSGYLYAHYDLVSDTVSVTFAAIQPTSCAA